MFIRNRKLLKLINNALYCLSITLLVSGLILSLAVAPVEAASGSVKTKDSCGSSAEDANFYAVGQTVFISYSNLGTGSHTWTIKYTNKPGKPLVVDALNPAVKGSGTVSGDSNCFAAWVVQPTEAGYHFTVDVDDKSDGYNATSATATPTVTATAVKSPTPTATSTTAVPTATYTATATTTATPTLTHTPTATATVVPPTATFTATATATSLPPTATYTATATITSLPPTATYTPTATTVFMLPTETFAPTATEVAPTESATETPPPAPTAAPTETLPAPSDTPVPTETAPVSTDTPAPTETDSTPVVTEDPTLNPTAIPTYSMPEAVDNMMISPITGADMLSRTTGFGTPRTFFMSGFSVLGLAVMISGYLKKSGS